MTEYVCYMLLAASGDSYIGVTGQGLHRRTVQHKRDGRIGGEFDSVVLGTSTSRTAINLLEKSMIALWRPSLNRMKGGTSAEGYRHGFSPRRQGERRARVARPPKPRKLPEVYCKRGHELTSGSRACKRCRQEYLASYYRTKLQPQYLRSA